MRLLGSTRNDEGPNFGDAMSPMLIEYLTKEKVRWENPDVAQIIGLGSILNTVINKVKNTKDKVAREKPIVWGSGLMEPMYYKRNETKGLDFVCVRGYLTAACLEQSVPFIGDPGLLLRDIYPELLSIEKIYKGALCLHHTQSISTVTANALKAEQWMVIKAGTNNFYEVIKAIAQSEVVISSSLHAIIAADSFVIPNACYLPGSIHIASEFKFYDYYTSIGREIERPIKEIRSMSDLDLLRNHLVDSFRGGYKKIDKIIDDYKNLFRT